MAIGEFHAFLRNGRQAFARPVGQYVDCLVLVAGTAKAYTVPANCSLIIPSCTATFRLAAKGQTAAVPTADVTSGLASEINPSAIRVQAGDTLSFISAFDCHLSLSCYKGDFA